MLCKRAIQLKYKLIISSFWNSNTGNDTELLNIIKMAEIYSQCFSRFNNDYNFRFINEKKKNLKSIDSARLESIQKKKKSTRVFHTYLYNFHLLNILPYKANGWKYSGKKVYPQKKLTQIVMWLTKTAWNSATETCLLPSEQW